MDDSEDKSVVMIIAPRYETVVMTLGGVRDLLRFTNRNAMVGSSPLWFRMKKRKLLVEDPRNYVQFKRGKVYSFHALGGVPRLHSR